MASVEDASMLLCDSLRERYVTAVQYERVPGRVDTCWGDLLQLLVAHTVPAKSACRSALLITPALS